MEDRLTVGRRHRPVRDLGQEAADLDPEPGLLGGLAKQRIEDRFAVVDASGGQPVGPARVEGLYR